MIPLGTPPFQGTAYFRYENREQRLGLQSLMQQMKYPHPDITSVTEFSSGSCGVAKVELSEWVNRKVDITPQIKKAKEWLEKQLTSLHIPKITEETTPAKAVVSFRYEDRTQRHQIENTVRKIHHPYPETINSSFFPNPSEGIAKVEISNLIADGPSTHRVSNTPKTQQALEWLEGILKTWHVEKISAELAKKV